MGKKGTDSNRKNWDRLIKQLRPWWITKYSDASYSWSILKGIMLHCRYTDEERKSIITRWLAGYNLDEDALNKVQLDQWDEDLSREAFSLEAISVLSKLSLLDEPLIIIFDQLEGLGRKQNRILLENFGEAIKELFTHVPNSLIIFNLFPKRWVQMREEIFDGSIVDRMSQYIVHLQRPSQLQLKAILQEKLNPLHLPLEDLFNNRELDEILGQPSIRAAINRAAAYYRHKIQGVALPMLPDHVDFEASIGKPSKLAQDNDSSVNHRLDRIEDTVRLLQEKLEALSTKFEMQGTSTPTDLPTDTTPKTGTIIVQDTDLDMLRDYLQQQREEVNVRYEKPTIIDDNDDLGKLLAIATEIQSFEMFDIQELRLGKKKLPEHLLIQNSQKGNVLAFLNMSGNSFTSRIRNFNQLSVNHRDFNFILMRDAREDPIKGKVGKSEIEKLNHTQNGQFIYLQREDRVELEVLYQLVIDIQNQDLEMSTKRAFALIQKHGPEHWILNKLFLHQ